METIVLQVDYDISELEVVKFSNFKADASEIAFKYEHLGFSRVEKYLNTLFVEGKSASLLSIHQTYIFKMSLIILLEKKLAGILMQTINHHCD